MVQKPAPARPRRRRQQPDRRQRRCRADGSGRTVMPGPASSRPVGSQPAGATPSVLGAVQPGGPRRRTGLEQLGSPGDRRRPRRCTAAPGIGSTSCWDRHRPWNNITITVGRLGARRRVPSAEGADIAGQFREGEQTPPAWIVTINRLGGRSLTFGAASRSPDRALSPAPCAHRRRSALVSGTGEYLWNALAQRRRMAWSPAILGRTPRRVEPSIPPEERNKLHSDESTFAAPTWSSEAGYSTRAEPSGYVRNRSSTRPVAVGPAGSGARIKAVASSAAPRSRGRQAAGQASAPRRTRQTGATATAAVLASPPRHHGARRRKWCSNDP